MKRTRSKRFWIFFTVWSLIALTYFSAEAFKYVIWGVAAEAKVTKTFPDIIRRKQRLVVEYTFIDSDGQQRDESDDIPSDWPVPGPKVTIEYLPSFEDSSRLKGNTDHYYLWNVLITGLIFGFSCFELYKWVKHSD